MLQYMLNTTAIWLLSLAIFDTFLRRESYHGYNRLYLLVTLLLGAILPLVQWQDGAVTPFSMNIRPIAQVIAAKQNIVAEAPMPDTSGGAIPWLAVVYSLGAVVALLLLIIDSIKLASLYHRGRATKQNGWTIIETRKEHAPFSFRNTLFVNTIAQYSSEEWMMILQHERRHTALWHMADLMLLQLARIVFWFHPLVYIYHRRVLLVHEYQADSVAVQQPQEYGKFLVEQALLQSAPVLSHSFNRSPIKNRIVMLTRRSTAVSKIKMLLCLPVVLVCVVCFSKNSFGQQFQRAGDKVTYRGNTFEFTKPKYDTMMVTDPVTKEENMMVIRTEPVPQRMNGKKVYNTDEVTTRPAPKTQYGPLEMYILKNLSSEFDKLPNGSYRLFLTNVVLDGMGKVVYYEYDGLENRDKAGTVPDAIKKAIEGKIDPLMLSAKAYQPGKVANLPVPTRTDIMMDEYKIDVVNNSSTFRKQHY